MKTLLIFTCLVVGALAGSKFDSNIYMDHLLSVSFPQYVRAFGLTTSKLSSFSLKVKKTSVTNRDLKAEFHNGAMTGLSLTRLGDCSPPGWQGTNVTLGCYVSLSSLRASYNGTAKGDNVLATNKTINVDAFFIGSKAFLETTSAPGSVPTVKTWSILPLTTRLSFSRKLDLNKTRQQKFESEVRRNVENSVTSALYLRVRDALNSAAEITKMPLP